MRYPYPVVEVAWLDAASSHGWESEDESDHSIPEVYTIGFLIHEDAHGVTVAATACAERTTNNRLKIPRGMIQQLRYIRGKPRAARAAAQGTDRLPPAASSADPASS